MLIFKIDENLKKQNLSVKNTLQFTNERLKELSSDS